MEQMEPFFFYQEDAMGSTAAAAATSTAVEELFSWEFRGLTDLVSPSFDPSPLPSEEDILLWGGDCDLPTSLSSPLPPPPPPSGAEMLLYWAPPPGPAPPPLLEQATPPARGVRWSSAFVGYERGRRYGCCRKAAEGNIHRRVLGCLRSMPVENEERKAAAEGSRCFRHMMRERRRRERLSQSYADLHSMIVPRPKANKNAIVLSAAAYVRELKSRRDALHRRHQELRASLAEMRAAAGGEKAPEGATVRLRVGGDPTSGTVDSIIAALRQLKGMDVRARSIRYRPCPSGEDLSAVVDVETKVSTTYGAHPLPPPPAS